MVSNNTIDAKKLAQMFIAGAADLESHKEWINELNVFPVPDGDTGTNMTLTIQSAAKEVVALGDEFAMKDVCKAMSSGSLRGARGNSGVILSQLIRGFGKVVKGEEEITIPLIADAFERAVETAYKAVMKPKEGTILTVAKGASVKARELAEAGETDMAKYLGEILEETGRVLASTPDMLPVLKQAGVVDSGGQGLFEVLQGAYDCFMGKEIDFSKVTASEQEAEAEGKEEEQETPEFLYKVKVYINLSSSTKSKSEKDFVKGLGAAGDRVKVAKEENLLKVRVYTNDPGDVIQGALKLGEIQDARIANIRPERTEAPAEAEKVSEATEAEKTSEVIPAERKDVGFITVSVGEGIEKIFKELGVDYVISGGQTMNPSTEDVLQAIEKVNADTIFVLPNNKNIVMAANQAASITEDKKVVVVPTTTVPQGITAVINYVPDLDAEANKANMIEEIARVSSAEVTYAVRNTVIDDIEIKEGNIMGIGDAGILTTGEGIEDTAFDTLAKIVDEDTEIISIYYGADVTEEMAEKLRDRAAQEFDSCDVELQFGGQPIYYYIMSAE